MSCIRLQGMATGCLGSLSFLLLEEACDGRVSYGRVTDGGGGYPTTPGPNGWRLVRASRDLKPYSMVLGGPRLPFAWPLFPLGLSFRTQILFCKVQPSRTAPQDH